MLKLSNENLMFDLPELNKFRIGDKVVADACEKHDRFEGVVVGIEMRKLGNYYFKQDITILSEGSLVDGFKPSDLRKLEPEQATPLPYPNELTGDLKTVLSKMLWETGPIAEFLRAGGEKIPNRAEDEQAHVLHWLIKILLKHGDDYRTAAVEHLRKCDAARIANRDGGAAA
ncbi:hypothetical protein [Agrobacterium fabrum]|uniref:hypothetical protein n=1 Tax=Agrobacterium fabrum TaxID=1176649 RepID=UPI003BA2038A